MADHTVSQDVLIIERSFDVPVDVVWLMWTDPDHFKQWYGPGGAAIPSAQMDLQIGGTRRVCMEVATLNGPRQMWFIGEYREVVENKRLVYTESMADEHGNVLSAADMGMPAGHPTTTEVRVEFEDHGARTKMVMTHVGVAADSSGAAGWTMAFDKLGARLAARAVQ